jgi:hypothetical protein
MPMPRFKNSDKRRLQKIAAISGEKLGLRGCDLRASARAVPMSEWLSAEGGAAKDNLLQKYSFQIEGGPREYTRSPNSSFNWLIQFKKSSFF